DPYLLSGVAGAAGDAGVAAFLDGVGGPTASYLFSALRVGGRIVAYGAHDNRPVRVTNAILVYRNLTWSGFGIDRWLSSITCDDRATMLERLWALIRRGALPLPVAACYPLADVQAALAADASSTRKGKVLLVS